LEENREAYQPEERLEGFGDLPRQEELKKMNMSEEEDKKQRDNLMSQGEIKTTWGIE
jgi:hypothetical protein